MGEAERWWRWKKEAGEQAERLVEYEAKPERPSAGEIDLRKGHADPVDLLEDAIP